MTVLKIIKKFAREFELNYFYVLQLKYINMETIKKTIAKVYSQMPEFFRFPDLADLVKANMQLINRNPMDGTIQRELREMRENGELNYTVFDYRRSIYKKSK